MRLKIAVPNFISVFWGLICIIVFLSCLLRIADNSYFSSLVWLESVAWVFILVISTLNVKKKELLPKYSLKVIYWFILLIGIILFGNFYGVFSHGIRNVFSCVVVVLFVYNINLYDFRKQLSYIRFFYWALAFEMLYLSLGGYSLGNTMPGCMVFLTCSYLLMEWLRNKSNNLVISVCSISITSAVCFLSRSRTALFVFLLILISYCFFYLVAQMRRKKMFFIIIIFAFFLTIFYANITDFDWYIDINDYSQLYFSKNIGSSRSRIWKSAVDSLKGIEFIFGKGSGILPNLDGYENSSFHNYFLQLTMQNGIVGLLCLINILKVIWDKICVCVSKDEMSFRLAIFTGIIAYNIMETTLLQNKLLLGIIQWFSLFLGLNIINV